MIYFLILIIWILIAPSCRSCKARAFKMRSNAFKTTRGWTLQVYKVNI